MMNHVFDHAQQEHAVFPGALKGLCPFEVLYWQALLDLERRRPLACAAHDT